MNDGVVVAVLLLLVGLLCFIYACGLAIGLFRSPVRHPFCPCGWPMAWRWFWSDKHNRKTGQLDRRRFWVCTRPYHDIREDRHAGIEGVFGRNGLSVEKHDGWDDASTFSGNYLDGDENENG